MCRGVGFARKGKEEEEGERGRGKEKREEEREKREENLYGPKTFIIRPPELI